MHQSTNTNGGTPLRMDTQSFNMKANKRQSQGIEDAKMNIL